MYGCNVVDAFHTNFDQQFPHKQEICTNVNFLSLQSIPVPQHLGCALFTSLSVRPHFWTTLENRLKQMPIDFVVICYPVEMLQNKYPYIYTGY